MVEEEGKTKGPDHRVPSASMQSPSLHRDAPPSASRHTELLLPHVMSVCQQGTEFQMRTSDSREGWQRVLNDVISTLQVAISSHVYFQAMEGHISHPLGFGSSTSDFFFWEHELFRSQAMSQVLYLLFF